MNFILTAALSGFISFGSNEVKIDLPDANTVSRPDKVSHIVITLGTDNTVFQSYKTALETTLLVKNRHSLHKDLVDNGFENPTKINTTSQNSL